MNAQIHITKPLPGERARMLTALTGALFAIGDRVITLGWGDLGTVTAIEPGRAWQGRDLLTVRKDNGMLGYYDAQALAAVAK